MGEVLQRYLRTLADYSVDVKKYQQAFLAPLPGTPLFLVIALRNVNNPVENLYERCRLQE
jgi:hypothetical protein